MNTLGIILSPFTTLLQPHVGRFHASDLDFRLPTVQGQFWPSSGGMPHVGAAIVVVWHFMGV